MRILVFLFGWFDSFDLFNSRELCGQYGVLHPRDLWSINVSPFLAVLAVVVAFGMPFYFIGHGLRFW